MHEIVTLQFGQKANYVGTHFWNTQESYFTYDATDTPSIVDHDINFRPGIGKDGSDTYTPRALIYDLKNGFGSLRRTNALYEDLEVTRASDVWDGTQQVQTAPSIPPSAYQVALEAGLQPPRIRSKDVRYWSDYNRLFLHPRSLVQLSSQSLTSQLSAFESYSAGIDLFRHQDQESGGLLDRDLRPFVEECDSLQGFQIFGASDDAWGGFMSQYVEEIREEYGKKSVWVWGLEEDRSTERSKRYLKLANSAHTLTNATSNSSAYIRLSSPPTSQPEYLRVDANSAWSSAALLSSFIESVTLPTRLRRAHGITTSNMNSIEGTLSGGTERNIWDLKARASPVDKEEVADKLPLPNVSRNGHLNDQRIDHTRSVADTSAEATEEGVFPSSFEICFAPSLPQIHVALPSLRSRVRHRSSHIFAQVEANRYTPQSHNLYRTARLSPEERLRRLYNDESIVEVFNMPLAFPILDSFPNDLFHFSSLPPQNQQPGSRAQKAPAMSTSDVNDKKSVNLSAALSTTSQTQADLLSLRDLVVGSVGRAMGLVHVDERETMYDELTRLGENYSFGFDDDDSDLDEDEAGSD